MISEKYGSQISGTITTIIFDSLRRKFRAREFGEYPASKTAFSTRFLVDGDTFSGFIKALETVAVDTPAN
jgi:hypothetical protein